MSDTVLQMRAELNKRRLEQLQGLVRLGERETCGSTGTQVLNIRFQKTFGQQVCAQSSATDFRSADKSEVLMSAARLLLPLLLLNPQQNL